MTRDELYATIEAHVTVTDEWGGEKIAGWKYGFNLCVANIDDAVDAIMPAFDAQQAKIDALTKALEKIKITTGRESIYKIAREALESVK